MDLRFPLFVSGVNQGNEGGRCVEDILLSNQGRGSFPSIVSRAWWCHFVRVKCFWMIKPMVVVLFY